jgi:uncharacterized membrane protein YcaP (DUF421 family)
MDKHDIHLSDLQRILFGEAPPIFLLEVFVRTLVIYVFLLYTLRYLGKRMSGQLTIMELAVMLTLGAIVSASMQLPDHGILEGLLLLLCAFSFQRGISYLGVKSKKFEELTQGKAGMLVADGVMQVATMEKFRISQQQIFSQLRAKNIYNLGMVDRMYLESNGMFSIFKSKAIKPGLSVLPPNDPMVQSIQRKSGLVVCTNCGFVKEHDKVDACKDCGHCNWIEAVE